MLEASINFINVLNHNQLLDPTLNIAGQTRTNFWPAFHGRNFPPHHGIWDSG